MKSKLLKIIKTLSLCGVFILGIACVAVHAGHYEITPSTTGNVLKIYDTTAGKLYDEFNAAILQKEYSHIIITGEMLPIDFCVLSTKANRCKSINLSGIKTSKIPGLAFGSRNPGDEVNLEEFIFPESLKIIERGTLDGCPHLKKVTLSKDLKIIEDNCFEWCPKLMLEIPKNVKINGSTPFYASPNIRFEKITPQSEPVSKLWKFWSNFCFFSK